MKIDYKKERPIVEVFSSIEGEGMTSGEPTIFVRLSGCNLRCMFANSICDTSYTSFTPEKGKYTYSDVVKMMNKYPNIASVSITGGEPFLHPKVVEDLCDIFLEADKYVIVETNGTIDINPILLAKIDLVNISPKLSSSQPTEEKCIKSGIEYTSPMKNHSMTRYNVNALLTIIKSALDYRLKYVIGSEEDFIEVEEQISHLNSFGLKNLISPWQVILMPAGATNEELNQNRKMVADYCVKKGYCYSDRLQVVIWGTEKER